ncbi:MAG: VCBS repeat-containing protein, partial [Bacteroidota bacterium]
MNISIVKALIVLALLVTTSSVTRAQNDSPCNQNRVDLPQIEPRHPDLICLPELGRRNGPIAHCVLDNERYGKVVAALGSVGSDSLPGWIIAHQRCDTVAGNGRLPEELLVYRGIAGSVPSSGDGQRIGPSEVLSVTQYLAVGDWDHDGNKDLAVRIQIYGDTSGGNTEGYETSRAVIFWGNVNGTFSLTDTTHLLSADDLWLGLYRAVSTDFDADGVDDLLIWGGGGLRGGAVISTPTLHLFRGHQKERWGEGVQKRTADWTWWNPPPLNNLGVMDQDHDGKIDLVLYNNPSHSTPGQVSVLYGKPGGDLPDTSNVETVDLASSFGLYSLFSDVTGDGVPELLIHSREQIK